MGEIAIVVSSSPISLPFLRGLARKLAANPPGIVQFRAHSFFRASFVLFMDCITIKQAGVQTGGEITGIPAHVVFRLAVRVTPPTFFSIDFSYPTVEFFTPKSVIGSKTEDMRRLKRYYFFVPCGFTASRF